MYTHKLIITLWRALNSAWKGGHRLVKVKLMYGTSAVLFASTAKCVALVTQSKCSGGTIKTNSCVSYSASPGS